MDDKTQKTDVDEKENWPDSDSQSTGTDTETESIEKNARTKFSFKKLITIILVVFAFLVFSTSALAYTIAYEKVALVKKYPKVQMYVANLVQSIPFMPKTPRFLLAKTASVHQKVTKQTFEISAAFDSDVPITNLGLSNLDLKAEGFIDYSDLQNINTKLNLSVTKDYNFDLIKKDKMLYFKINKISPLILPFLGVNKEKLDPLLAQWVSYDMTPLQSEARKYLEENKEKPSVNPIDENLQKYIDDEAYEHMNVEKTEYEDARAYKITLSADSALIDHIGSILEKDYYESQPSTFPQEHLNLSELVKTMVWEIYIDKNFFTRKIVASMDLDLSELNYETSLDSYTQALPTNSYSKLVIAAKFDNFNNNVAIDEPQEAITSDEFTYIISDVVKASSPSADLTQ